MFLQLLKTAEVYPDPFNVSMLFCISLSDDCLETLHSAIPSVLGIQMDHRE